MFKIAQKIGPKSCTIVQGLWPNFFNMARREFSIFRTLSNAYTVAAKKSSRFIVTKLLQNEAQSFHLRTRTVLLLFKRSNDDYTVR